MRAKLGRTGRVAVVVALVALSSCGGGSDDDEEAAVATEPIVAVSPCDLLGGDEAAELSGADVGTPVASVDDDGTATCEVPLEDGSAIAASLRIGPGDDGDVPGGAIARSLDLGDGGAVEADEDDGEVRVVYVVEQVAVTIVVAPPDGDVGDDVVDRVVDFAQTTVAPVTEAVTGEAPAPTTTTTGADEEEATTTTAVDATTTTTAAEEELEAVELELGAATTATFGPGEELVYAFDAEAGDTVTIAVLALTDDSVPEGVTPCANIALYSPSGVLGLGSCFAAPPTGTPSGPIPLGEAGRHTVTVSGGADGSGSVTFQVSGG